jgi:hypothetical protein
MVADLLYVEEALYPYPPLTNFAPLPFLLFDFLFRDNHHTEHFNFLSKIKDVGS